MQDTMMTPVGQSVNKKDKRYLIGMIALAVVAVVGVGFGVFGMVTKGQADDKTRTLNEELQQKDEALKELEERTGIVAEVDDESEPIESAATVSAAQDYVYIGEWGIKIKIPEKLKSVSYAFYGGKDLLYISGAVCDNGRCQYYPAFLENTEGTGLGALGRYRKDDSTMSVQEREDGTRLFVRNDEAHIGGIIAYENDDYYFCYSTGQALYGTESEKDWEADSVALIKEMLQSGITAF